MFYAAMTCYKADKLSLGGYPAMATRELAQVCFAMAVE